MEKNQTMPEQPNQLEYLLQQYADNQATPAELQELVDLLQQNRHEEELKQLLATMAAHTNALDEYDTNDVNSMILRILNQKDSIRPAVHRVSFLRNVRWWAAACIAVLLCLGSYFIFFNNKQTGAGKTELSQDVKPPDRNRAMVTLADGNQVYLDSVSNGEFAKQGNISLVKLNNGKIAYESLNSEVTKVMKYNTLFNPRGSKVINLTLTDGSEVWLNAGSSLTYPLAFAENERKVTITGEAYFEVAHDAEKPFKVSKGSLEITVLGTHFNVNAYDDEENMKVTLLEGSVKTSIVNGESAILKPGQQAVIHHSQLATNENVDLDAVVAWKNGWFQFNGLRVEDIMREISRWYDVEVDYAGKPAQKHFSGILSRNSNVRDVLMIMEQANIHFKIDGRKIIVME